LSSLLENTLIEIENPKQGYTRCSNSGPNLSLPRRNTSAAVDLSQEAISRFRIHAHVDANQMKS